MPTMLERWTADAVAKERTMFEKRTADAVAKERVAAKAESVLTALRTRFNKVPQDIETAILAMSDSIALESLHVQAIQSDTLDEFAEGL